MSGAAAAASASASSAGARGGLVSSFFSRYRQVSCVSATASGVRVIFVHGMQADPNQYKAKVVEKAGFNLHVPDMGTKYLCWISLCFLSLLLLLAILLAHQLQSRTSKRTPFERWCVALVFMAVCTVVLIAFNRANAAMWRWKFRQCTKQIAASIREFQPHAIVASSFGAAVTVELISQGVWGGATVLLSPAVDRVHKMIRRKGELPLIPALNGVAVSVVHGRSDWIAPYKDALRLFKESYSVGQFIDAGWDGHFLNSWNDPMDMRSLVCDTIDFALNGRNLTPFPKHLIAKDQHHHHHYSHQSDYGFGDDPQLEREAAELLFAEESKKLNRDAHGAYEMWRVIRRKSATSSAAPMATSSASSTSPLLLSKFKREGKRSETEIS